MSEPTTEIPASHPIPLTLPAAAVHMIIEHLKKTMVYEQAHALIEHLEPPFRAEIQKLIAPSASTEELPGPTA